MKIKNINFFERHIEKMVLLAGVAFAVGVIWMFGRSVTVDYSGQAISPAQIEQKIYDEALRLEEKVDSPDDPFDEVAMPPYARRFEERYWAPLLGVTSFTHAMGTLGLDYNDFDPSSQARQTFTLPQPPEPTGIIAFNEFSVLADHEYIVDFYRALYVGPGGDAQAKVYGQNVADSFARLVPERIPRDFHYVTVGGLFSIKQWQDKNAAVPQDQRIPEEWLLSRLGLVDVILERQTLQADGTWSSPEPIALLPGSHPYRDRPQEFDKKSAEDLIDAAHFDWVRIARPPFPPLAGDRIWKSPHQRRLSEEERAEANKILREIKRIDRLIANSERELQSILDRNTAPEKKKPQRREPEAPAGGGGGPQIITINDAGGDTGGPIDDSPRRNLRTGNDRANELRTKIEELKSQRVALLYDLDVLTGVIQPVIVEMKKESTSNTSSGRSRRSSRQDSVDSEMGVTMVPDDVMMVPQSEMMTTNNTDMSMFGGDTAGSGWRPNRNQQEPMGDEIKVSAHDLTVEPGKTYRYRLIVDVLNPLFWREGQLTKDQEKQYLHMAAVASPPSEWSQPITIRRNDYFFTVSANAPQQTATVEVWRIFNGNWRTHDFPVEPGEPVGRKISMDVEMDDLVEVDMTVDALMVDVVKSPGANTIDREVLFLDIPNKVLLSRSVTGDRDNEMRHELQQEKELLDADLDVRDLNTGDAP